MSSINIVCSKISFHVHIFRVEKDLEIFDKQQKKNNILGRVFTEAFKLLNSSNIYLSGYDERDKKLKRSLDEN